MKKMILALAVAMATMAAAAHSYAMPITIAFTGQVTDFSGTPRDFGVDVGDAVSGTFTFNPPSDPLMLSSPDSSIFLIPGAFTFSTGASGSGDGAITTSQSISGGIAVESHFGTSVNAPSGYLSLALATTDDVPVATSLSSLSLAAYFANAGTFTGLLALGGSPVEISSFLNFDVLSASVVSATPIPPALVMFMTALGGLGFVGWRRRRMAAAAA